MLIAAAAPGKTEHPRKLPIASHAIRKVAATQLRPTPYQVSVIPICPYPGTLIAAVVKAFVDGEEKRSWTVPNVVLLNALADLLGEESASAAMSRMSSGESIGLPELYSAHDLCLLGYRVSRRR